MKKQIFLFTTIILNFLSTPIWGEDFFINYYHKGEIIHTQQVTQGSTIEAFPILNLESCNSEINIFAGWITEEEVTKYQTINTSTPTFVATDYIPTTDINLYAVFADREATNDITWQQIKSRSELKDNDQIIITANNYNYAIGKTIDNTNRLTAIEITKSEDKSTLIPNDDVQIFTLKRNSDVLWSLRTNEGYLGNMSAENSVKYYAEIKDWSTWGFSFETTSHATLISNQHGSHKYPYLYYNANSNFFACRTSSTPNLAIYKQKPIFEVNYLSCTSPDAVEYTITLHDGDNTSEIKCMSDATIVQPTPSQNIDHWEFYGWTTTPINETITAPEIITFPYTPTENINLYAVYKNTTADSLIMQNKTIPANWEVNTLALNENLALYKGNYIKIPHINNITQIDINMGKNSIYDPILYINTDFADLSFIENNITSTRKEYTFTFKPATSTSLHIHSNSKSTNYGIAINKITIHHTPIFSTSISSDIRNTLTFLPNTDSTDIKKHYAITQSRGKNITLPKNIFSNGQYNFLEWNTAADGSGIAYEDEATIKNISSDITLYAQWGNIDTIKSEETKEIYNTTSIDKLLIKSDISGKTGEIKFNDNSQLHINKNIIFEKIIDGSRYYFFSLPFNCNIEDIIATDSKGKKLQYATTATNGDYVINLYDQSLAAQNAGNINQNAWVELLGTDHTLQANRGYIIGYFGKEKNATIKFKSAENNITLSNPNEKTLNFGEDYEWFTSSKKLSSCGWNLIGSPYFETINQGSLTQFVTIPNNDGKTYTQCTYADALELNLIQPFNSFFIQLNQNEAPIFAPQNINTTMVSFEQSEKIVIEVHYNNTKDITTIINNDEHTQDYNIGSDLVKWIGYSNIPQLYTIEEGIPLAFNTQKITKHSIINLGIYAPYEGEYTFSANHNNSLYLTDNQTNITTDISSNKCTIFLNKGLNEQRFSIQFKTLTSTKHPTEENNGKINYYIQNDIIYLQNSPQNANISIYNSTGKLIKQTKSSYFTLPQKGIYHIIITKNNNIINNFTIIY